MKANNFSPVYYLLLAVLPMAVLVSCSSSKNSVITVQGPTVSSETPDTLTNNEVTEPAGSAFQALTIGENQPIHSLDPLFAITFSEMQAIQLVYEGLVRFDNRGKIVPAIAESWTVDDHHRRYQFNLKDDVFYQNSSIFSSGRGRKLRAGDIKKDFERMARADVPAYAAHLFMNIRGFEPYFQEQHHIFRQSERQFHGVSGIKVPNDSTIVFTLVQSDRQFLQKLASPYAVIYPPGAARGDQFKAVGTGPFKFAARRADSLYIFARAKNYHENNQPKLNRVNIITSSHSRVLLKLMKQGYINLIPALDPQQMADVSQADSETKPSFSQEFHLLKPAGRTASFRMKYNSNAIQPEDAVVNALSPLLGMSFFSGPPPNSVHLQWSFPEISSSSPADTLSSNYTEDPFIRAFYTMLKTKLGKQNISFTMKQTRAVNRTIPFYTYRVMPPYGEFHQAGRKDQTLAKFEVNIWALTRKNVNNIGFNRYPWWINLRPVTVTSTYNR